MVGYYDEYGNWIEGPGPYEQPEAPPIYQGGSLPPYEDPGFNNETGPDNTNGGQPTGPGEGGTPPGGGRPTRRLGPNERPPNPYASQGAVWNDDWWDGKSDYLGGYLIPEGTPFGGGTVIGGGRTGAPVSGGYGDYDGAPAFGGQYGFPQLSLPRMQAPPEFSYEDFKMGDKFVAPDPSEIEKDPSYQWRFNEGQRAVKTSKAAQGVFGTGATLKALAGYGQNMAKTEYADIYGRAADTFDRNLGGRFNEWNANRTNKLDAYKTNWGVKGDVYDRDVTASNLEFAPKQKWAELQFGRDWDLYKYANDDNFRKWNAKLQAASNGSQPVSDT